MRPRFPHSPRWHNGTLWLIDSGTGFFGRVDMDKGEFEPLTFLPGFARGLTFSGDYAIVGLSDRGRTRVQMDLGGQGEARLSLLTSAGQRGVGLVVGADDAPFVSLFDAAGAQRLAMGIVQGSTVVNLGDGTRPRLVLGVADNGRASVAFYDAEGALVRDVSADGR
ncbi:MAG: DUF4915 domain-containing protein [Acidobacteria bacterium]|nr:DUF4915 domain-containing protein [Acidobacteriota bacterium]